MVDIRCDKRTVEIVISPNIPPGLMRHMLIRQFERKIQAMIGPNNSGQGTKAPLKKRGSIDDPDMMSRMPNLENFGQVDFSKTI